MESNETTTLVGNLIELLKSNGTFLDSVFLIKNFKNTQNISDQSIVVLIGMEHSCIFTL